MSIHRRAKSLPKSSLTDEQAKDVIRQHLAGLPISYLADRTGFTEGCLAAICNGTNRAHLLRDVEMEGMR